MLHGLRNGGGITSYGSGILTTKGPPCLLCKDRGLGYGKQFLSRSSRALAYLNEMAYSLYILHQTVIIVVGYHVVQWDMNLYAWEMRFDLATPFPARILLEASEVT